VAESFADKELLRKLNSAAETNNYNRQLTREGIDSLPEDAIVALSPIIIHEHAAGVRVDPHLRCSVRLVYPTESAWGGLMLDVPMALFALLPTTQQLAQETA